MERSTTVIAGIRSLAAMASAALILACTPQQDARALTPQTLQAELDREIAKGASPETLFAWLARRGYEHSDLIDNASQAHLGADPETYEVKAIARKTSQSALVTSDLAMTFTFDRNKALTGISVKDVHTGP